MIVQFSGKFKEQTSFKFPDKNTNNLINGLGRFPRVSG